MNTFTESKTLGIDGHSANDDARQRVVSSRLYLMAVTFAESQTLALGKEATLSSVARLILGKL
jgi:hypothetical protein